MQFYIIFYLPDYRYWKSMLIWPFLRFILQVITVSYLGLQSSMRRVKKMRKILLLPSPNQTVPPLIVAKKYFFCPNSFESTAGPLPNQIPPLSTLQDQLFSSFYFSFGWSLFRLQQLFRPTAIILLPGKWSRFYLIHLIFVCICSFNH